MATPVANPTDVSDRIPTGLTDAEITTYLEDAVFDLEQEYSDYANEPTDWRLQIEWRLAAYKILVYKERETNRESRDSATLTFDKSRIEELRDEIRTLTDDKILSDQLDQAEFEVF